MYFIITPDTPHPNGLQHGQDGNFWGRQTEDDRHAQLRVSSLPHLRARGHAVFHRPLHQLRHVRQPAVWAAARFLDPARRCHAVPAWRLKWRLLEMAAAWREAGAVGEGMDGFAFVWSSLLFSGRFSPPGVKTWTHFHCTVKVQVVMCEKVVTEN